jgi:hypothetical protein
LKSGLKLNRQMRVHIAVSLLCALQSRATSWVILVSNGQRSFGPVANVEKHMSKDKNSRPDNPEQSKRFIEAARKTEADETQEGADKAFKKATSPKPKDR